MVKICPMALSGAAGKRLDHAMEEFLKKREGTVGSKGVIVLYREERGRNR